MVATKLANREQQELANRSKEKKIAQLKTFVAKFGSGTRASQVRSRVREIDRLQPKELKQSNIHRPYIRFAPLKKPSGKRVFKLKNITKTYDDNLVIPPFSFEVVQGQKIAIIGNNGIGKSTLLKMIQGSVIPDEGTIENGHQVEHGYFFRTIGRS